MARDKVVQFYGNGLAATVDTLVAALDILRSSGLPIIVTPVDAREAAAAGIWIRGDEEVVDKYLRILERRLTRLGVEALPAEYIRIGK
jgi:hypothetical protein